MLVFIEREQFLKLFKFGDIKIPITRFLDGFDPVDNKVDIPTQLLDAYLPLFEQDHEILILQISKESITFGIEISLKISQVKRLYPLTQEANRYLIGRMNSSIIVRQPVFENQINQIKIIRDRRLRDKATESMFGVFQVKKESLRPEYLEEIFAGINHRLGIKENFKNKNFIYHIVSFNRNPIYPQGPAEYLFKIASIYVEMKGGSEYNFEQGPLYYFLQENHLEIKRLNLRDSIEFFRKIDESRILVKELSNSYKDIDVLTIGAWFLYFKDILNKSNFDLSKIRKDIEDLKENNSKELPMILFMIGAFFGFDNLYSSLYDLNPIPIYNENVEPEIFEQNRNLKISLREEQKKTDQLRCELDKKIKTVEELEYNIMQLKQERDEEHDIHKIDIQGGKIEASDSDKKLDQADSNEQTNDNTREIESSNEDKLSNNISENDSEQVYFKSTKVLISKSKPKSKLPKEKKTGTKGQQVLLIDQERYSKDDLMQIIRRVNENGLLEKPSDQDIFNEAIISYSQNITTQEHLIAEIDELQKQLNLKSDVVKGLINIIKEVKK